MEQKQVKINKDQIVSFLSGIDLFKGLTQSHLLDLANSIQPISIAGGTTFIRQGDRDATMYILFQGRLRVHKVNEESSTHEEVALAEVSVGEIVGEIALFTHFPRTSTIKTVRDSILLKFDSTAFENFEKCHPTIALEMAKTALKRLVTKPRVTQISENVITIAIAPSGDSNHRLFAKQLVEELNKVKSTLLISQESCNRHFGKEIAQAKFHDPDNRAMNAWLQSLEKQYHYIIYETDLHETPWTQRCIRQADRLILVADHSSRSSLNSIEKSLFTESKNILPNIEMVFIHPQVNSVITNTQEWFKNRIFNGYHHLKLGLKQDIDKFIRFLNGQAFGVVLSGGAARALSHIGTLKALDELKIPIDFIAGTSMGAVIAAMYASFPFSDMIRFTEKFCDNYKMEWTLPLTSLTKGKYISDSAYDLWKETKVEDLWNRFFCISTNLREGKIQTHDRGLVWRAVRASTSFPALYPPMFSEEGDLLVDGGILNNMPVDTMRKMICGGKILAVNCNLNPIEITKRKSSQAWVSGWDLLLQKFNPFSKKSIEYENILTILLSSFNLCISSHQKRIENQADYFLGFSSNQYTFFDYKRLHDLIEWGYQTAMKKLPTLLKELQNSKK
ncbi:MAG: patatin-like phospholipase family protein [Chlamydiales bacterium]